MGAGTEGSREARGAWRRGAGRRWRMCWLRICRHRRRLTASLQAMESEVGKDPRSGDRAEPAGWLYLPLQLGISLQLCTRVMGRGAWRVSGLWAEQARGVQALSVLMPGLRKPGVCPPVPFLGAGRAGWVWAGGVIGRSQRLESGLVLAAGSKSWHLDHRLGWQTQQVPGLWAVAGSSSFR